MTKPRVLIREPIAAAGVELLRERFDVDENADAPLEEIIGKYDAIVIPCLSRRPLTTSSASTPSGA